MKKCTKCLEIKPFESFYKQNTIDGLSYWCKECYKISPGKSEALAILRNAIKSGTVIKPDHCDVCGKQSRLAAYHNDYSEPLDVLWLCRVCNKGLY